MLINSSPCHYTSCVPLFYICGHYYGQTTVLLSVTASFSFFKYKTIKEKVGTGIGEILSTLQLLKSPFLFISNTALIFQIRPCLVSLTILNYLLVVLSVFIVLYHTFYFDWLQATYSEINDNFFFMLHFNIDSCWCLILLIIKHQPQN